jgi:hypothetical protein
VLSLRFVAFLFGGMVAGEVAVRAGHALRDVRLASAEAMAISAVVVLVGFFARAVVPIVRAAVERAPNPRLGIGALEMLAWVLILTAGAAADAATSRGIGTSVLPAYILDFGQWTHRAMLTPAMIACMASRRTIVISAVYTRLALRNKMRRLRLDIGPVFR